MLSPHRVYMLAADHRRQWEEWCDARSIPRARIAEAKRLALDAFLLARDRSTAVREYGALLVDEQYASAVIADAMNAGVTVGTPAEKAGAFVKVLVRYRPDDDEGIVQEQWAHLEALQAWCRREGKPLVVEVLVSRRQEPEDEFEASGRPAMLAGFIGAASRRGVSPEFWKIEGTLSREGARRIDRAIAADPGCRQIILGKAADLATIDRWFAAAAASTTAVGFAIGRSLFWEASAAFLSGSRTADRAAADIAANYLQLVDAWQRSRAE